MSSSDKISLLARDLLDEHSQANILNKLKIMKVSSAFTNFCLIIYKATHTIIRLIIN